MQNSNDQAALVAKYFLNHFPLDLFTHKQLPSNKIEELADKYLAKVVEVFSVFDRLCRYEKYFADFIPPEKSGISEAEAVEHHLRSYIQEFYILRERIHNIVNCLKEDLTYYSVLNIKDIEDALDHLKKNVDKNFKKINDRLRRTHVHEISISDPDLVKTKFFAQVLSGEIPVPDGILLDMSKIKRVYENTINLSRNKHLQQAVHNSVGLKMGKQFFAARFGYIFAILNNHDGNIFDLKAHLRETSRMGK